MTPILCDRSTAKGPLALGKPAPPGDTGPPQHGPTRKTQIRLPIPRRIPTTITWAKNRG